MTSLISPSTAINKQRGALPSLLNSSNPTRFDSAGFPGTSNAGIANDEYNLSACFSLKSSKRKTDPLNLT